MSLNQILNAISVGFMLVLGILPIFFPRQTARLLHFDLPDGRGVAEVRIGIGGLVAGIAVATLIGRDPAMKYVIAGAWIGLWSTRLLSIVLDRPKLTPDFFGLMAIEMTMTVFALVS